MIDVLASQPHYVDHLAPVWQALPEEHRGVFVAVAGARARADALGIWTAEGLEPTVRLTLVASHADYVEAFERRSRPVAYLNHGVGQSWRDARGRLIPSGCGEARPGVRLFLTPGPHATSVTQEANGVGANISMVGSPKVEALRESPAPVEPLLVYSTHWDHKVVPEAKSVFSRYLPALCHAPVRVALHAHPRVAGYVRAHADGLGIEFIESFQEVCECATVYATDSSSTLFEFAALDRPVVVLNGPTYRRDHSHGLRFWEAANVGVQVDHAEAFPAAVTEALLDSPERREARAAALRLAYREFDGHAARRAVTALIAAQ